MPSSTPKPGVTRALSASSAARVARSLQLHTERIQKARAPPAKPAPRPSAVVATRQKPKSSPVVTPLTSSLSSLRKTTTPVAPLSILKKPGFSGPQPPKRVHFEFDNHTVARVRFFEAYNPQCAKFIRDPRDSNTPHIPGATRITKSNSQHFQVRFDGTYYPPHSAGLMGPDGHSPPLGFIPKFKKVHCPYCLANSSYGAFLFPHLEDSILDLLSPEEFQEAHSKSINNSWTCDDCVDAF